MRTAGMFLVVALLAGSGCAGMDGDGEDELLLRVRFSANAISGIEVVDRAAFGVFDNDLRPQTSGDIGILWTDYASGETLADGWMPPMQTQPERELYLAVPTPSTGEALLTVTLPSESGPFVVTAYLAL